MSDQFIPLPEVQKITGGKSRSTIYRWSRTGIFPKPRKTGPNSIGWLKSEIDEWLKQFQNRGAHEQ
ncbi:MAG: AlpA family phage regulatory protein [Thiotrichaceae bacterium]